MKRIFLLVMTNIVIMATIMILVHIFGFNSFISQNGINLMQLAGFSLVAGFTGAFISLAISKWMAKMSMKVKIISGNEGTTERWLVSVVETQAQKLGISTPEVGIFQADELNAFATGPTKNNALVAVSTGLLRAMPKAEVEAVLGHEMSHVANGDMVTSTLIMGVLNSFTIFLSRIISFAIDRALSGNNNNENHSPGMAYYISSIVLDIVFGILAGLVIAYHSRIREYKADKGGAELVNKQAMISALAILGKQSEATQMDKSLAAFGIRGGRLSLFATHPPIEKRIAALQNN